MCSVQRVLYAECCLHDGAGPGGMRRGWTPINPFSEWAWPTAVETHPMKVRACLEIAYSNVKHSNPNSSRGSPIKKLCGKADNMSCMAKDRTGAARMHVHYKFVCSLCTKLLLLSLLFAI